MKKSRNKKILICDDQKKIRKIYADLLIYEGFEILEAAGAVIANELLVKEDVDLVLLDIKMPEVGGEIVYDVMEMFHKDVKVIVSSVYSISEQKKMIRNAAAYHDKAHGPDVLMEMINKVLADDL